MIHSPIYRINYCVECASCSWMWAKGWSCIFISLFLYNRPHIASTPRRKRRRLSAFIIIFVWTNNKINLTVDKCLHIWLVMRFPCVFNHYYCVNGNVIKYKQSHLRKLGATTPCNLSFVTQSVLVISMQIMLYHGRSNIRSICNLQSFVDGTL